MVRPVTRRRAGQPSTADAVTAALQHYADRGVFRGFSTEGGRGGLTRYRFIWLTRRPMDVVFDPPRRRLRFPRLFPHVGSRSPMVADLRRAVAARGGRTVPPHKRLDQRKARVSCEVREGGFRLTVDIKGAQEAYAVRAALNLVNDLFLLLHQSYPDYLVEQFGISTE